MLESELGKLGFSSNVTVLLSFLKIKGTTIKDFDTTISVQKTLRKPEKVLPNVLKTDGKVAMKNIWKDINTVETPANGRINADIILLKTSMDLFRLNS